MSDKHWSEVAAEALLNSGKLDRDFMDLNGHRLANEVFVTEAADAIRTALAGAGYKVVQRQDVWRWANEFQWALLQKTIRVIRWREKLGLWVCGFCGSRSRQKIAIRHTEKCAFVPAQKALNEMSAIVDMPTETRLAALAPQERT